MRELECNRALLVSGADVSMLAFEVQDSFNIHRDIN